MSFAPPGEAPGAPLADAPNVHGARRHACRLCGECIVGCQFGAKNTLDFTYVSAAQRAGAAIRCCCEATLLAPRDGGGWTLRYRQHLRPRTATRPRCSIPTDAPEREVRARAVVLAAGTFGSTRLLLANRAGLPRLSPRLGTGFSSNGDLLFFVRGADRALDPSSGPTITMSARVRRPPLPQRPAVLPPGRGRAGAGREWLWQAVEAPEDLWRLRPRVRRRLGARLRGARRHERRRAAGEALGARASRRRCCRCSAWAATCPAGA